jgi:glycerol-3-phosphate dehydrogenase (NAD(P)+)
MANPIAILGAGSWGTALALYLAKQNQAVRLWTHEAERIETMVKDGENKRYLPGHVFPANLILTYQLSDATDNDADILIAIPSAGIRDVLLTLKPLLDSPRRIVWASKGLDMNTGQLLHEVALEVLGNKHHYAVLSGPSFASEVAKGLPTAVVVASHQPSFTQDLTQRFNSSQFRVYGSTDVVGVEIGGIVKNVLAIATGMSDGMQLGANARCALITRGLAEMVRLGLAAGGQYETFTGLSGLGDLILTSTDNQSRNRRFGLALGNGKSTIEAEREIGQVIEGKRNAELIIQLAKKLEVEMPICATVWEILQGNITLAKAIANLLARAPKAEN